MAGSIADMLVASTLESSDKAAPDLGKAMAEGAELGLKIQEMKQSRAKLEQQKKDLQQAKIKEMSEDLLKAEKLGGKALAGYKKFLVNKATTYGINDIFSPDTIETVTAQPENMARFNVLVDDVVRGEKTVAEAISILNDPSQFYDVRPDMLKTVREAGQKAFEEKEKMRRVERQGQLAMGKQIQGQEAAPEVDLKKKINADYNKFTADKSGFAKAVSTLKDLQSVRTALKSGKLKTGSVGDIATSLAGVVTPGDSARAVFTDDVKVAQDKVRGAIRLKDSLDSQFAMAEAQQEYAKAFDPNLKTMSNFEKVDKLYNESILDLKSKFNQFRKIDPNFEIPEELQKFLDEAPAVGSAKTENKKSVKTYTVGGKQLTAEQAKAFYKANPKFLKDEKLKKELGL